MIKSRFTTKIILLATLPIFAFSLFLAIILNNKLNDLNARTADISGTSLNEIYTHLLSERVRGISDRISLKLNAVITDINISRAAAQDLIDKRAGSVVNVEPATIEKWFDENFYHDAKHGWSLSKRDETDVSISVWEYLHTEEGEIAGKAQDYILSMRPMLPLLKYVGRHGAEKGWYYIVGPHDYPVVLSSPWGEMPKKFDEMYPGHNGNNFWDFFFPGVIESWNQWAASPDFDPAATDRHLTITPIYEDAGGSGLMISLFAPLWDKSRTRNYGSAAVDYNINNITDISSNEKIGESGFSFLAKGDGSLLGLTDAMRDTLEIKNNRVAREGLTIESYHLQESEIEALKAMGGKLSEITDSALFSFTNYDGKTFLIAFNKMMDFKLWSPGDRKLIDDVLFVAAVIPKDEINLLQEKIKQEINQASLSTLDFLLIISVIFALSSMSIAGWYAVLKTRQIRHIYNAALKVARKDYDVSIDIISQDELGVLAQSFNKMISEVRHTYTKLENYANNLEQMVRDRTLNLEEANKKLEELSQKDGLTQLYNRRFFDSRFQDVWSEYSRLGLPLSIIMIDVDYFKKYNDHYGHQAGDACLCAVASALKSQLRRSSDLLARYGGEEMVVICCVNAADAFNLAEKMCRAVRDLGLDHAGSDKGCVTISLGLATILPSKDKDRMDLLRYADQALYQSKAQGRDRVSSAG